MGLSAFGNHSSYTVQRCDCGSVQVLGDVPNPNPNKWELLELVQFDNAYAMKVRYLDCTNFEGVKIMVYRGKYQHRDFLDPHFTEGDDSPVARFKPDKNGWRMAKALAEALEQEK